MMTVPALALLAGLAAGQEAARVERGDIQARIKASGEVVAEGVFRLKSAVEGRVEQVFASTFSWASKGEVLGTLANKDLTAMLDSAGEAQAKAMLEGRAQRLYEPTEIVCPRRCFILKKYIKPKQLVRPEALLIEAAGGLKIAVSLPPDRAKQASAGHVFEFWSAARPEKKWRARIPRYGLDAWGGSFDISLSPEIPLVPGEAWEGVIYADLKKGARTVPTRALIRHEDKFYLPVAVSTGAMTEERAEVLGADEGREILILADSQLKTSGRARPEAPADAAPAAPAARGPRPEEEPLLAPPGGAVP